MAMTAPVFSAKRRVNSTIASRLASVTVSAASASTPALVRDIGLVCFVTAVGFIAGPKFFRNFKQNAKSYVLLGFIIILVGALSCAAIILLAKLPTALGVGLMTGALTSTPGLAAAQGAAGELSAQAAIGYAIAYPFGVVGVVLFVQLMPKLLKADMKKEVENLEAAAGVNVRAFEGDFSLLEPLSRRERHLMVHDWCEGCGRCEARCGQHAIRVVDGRARVDQEKCVLCGYCAGVCPQVCIKVV